MYVYFFLFTVNRSTQNLVQIQKIKQILITNKYKNLNFILFFRVIRLKNTFTHKARGDICSIFNFLFQRNILFRVFCVLFFFLLVRLR